MSGLRRLKSGMCVATLPRTIFRQLLQAARARPDTEVCGLISARDGAVMRCYPIPNIHARPQRAFEMAPESLIDAFRDIRGRGEQLWGIYHSHPTGPATPSGRDLAESGYPEALQLIITPHEDPPVHAWRFQEETAVPVSLEIG
jgi:[CysO sulfur-carrier protein]-S-L-cysteine hydrolase